MRETSKAPLIAAPENRAVIFCECVRPVPSSTSFGDYCGRCGRRRREVK